MPSSRSAPRFGLGGVYVPSRKSSRLIQRPSLTSPVSVSTPGSRVSEKSSAWLQHPLSWSGGGVGQRNADAPAGGAVGADECPLKFAGGVSLLVFGVCEV
jgi:hypothetical protein